MPVGLPWRGVSDRDDTATSEDRRAPAERLVAGAMIDETGVGQPLTERARQRQRSVESYLRGEALPRYVQRLREIERATEQHRERLERAFAAIQAAHAGDPEAFAAAWRVRAAAWDFAHVNALVDQHNRYYPIERDLPMDPRTGDYVPVSGRPYRREPLGTAWILARFPA